MAEYGNYTFDRELTQQKAPTFWSELFFFYRGLAAAAATAVVAVGCGIVVAAIGALTLTTATAVVILLGEQEYEDKDQYPCAGIAAEKSVAAHTVLPPFSDFTIYYAGRQQGVKNQISGV